MPKTPNHSIKVLLLGGIILDRYFIIEHYPKSGKDALIQRSFNKVGGCSLNVAVTLKNLGTTPFIVSKLGDDEVGKEIEKYIEALELPKTYMLIAIGKQSGYCLTILEQDGERTFFTYKGCEAELSLEELPLGSFNGFAFAYITGYYLVNHHTASAVLELTAELKRNGCQILFDPGALVGEIDTNHLRELIKLSAWLVPNSNELAIIRDKLDIGDDTENWLFNQGVQGLVVKQGNLGVDVYTSTESFTLTSLKIQTKDTTGAGDSFAGGLIHGLTHGYSLFDAVSLANACGAFSSTFLGPHAEFSLDDIHDFLASL